MGFKMNLLAIISHPVTQALFDGVKYTTPKVMAAIQQNMMAKPVTENDIQQAAATTAEPDFGESQQPTITEVSNENQT